MKTIPLPPPETPRTGWPWSAEETPAYDLSLHWPKITVITPSFNQGCYLEETIRSILLQGYPNLEYFVIDGGSRDNSPALIQKYSSHLAWGVSEPDRGQGHAINKGLERATGDVVAWLNSDDWYKPGTLEFVGRHFRENPESHWLACGVQNFWDGGELHTLVLPRFQSAAALLGRQQYAMHQPGIFWSRQALKKNGLLNEQRHYSFDHEYWFRLLLQGFTPVCKDFVAAGFRLHPDSKTQSNLRRTIEEDWEIFDQFVSNLPAGEQAQSRRWLVEYEAGYMMDITYTLLVQKGRLAALRYLQNRASIAAHIRPRKLVLGALARIILTGKPAPWFRSQVKKT